MTKQDILDEFNDINFAYNNSSKHETLSWMLDELLKEQEAVKPIIIPWLENEDGECVLEKRKCGRCGYQFFTVKPNFCENCGTPILWEDEMKWDE